MASNKIQKPKISIVIPAYNEAEFLPRCLKSLNNQVDAPAYEVIVVDNNSTDSTSKIAKKLGAKVIIEKERGVVAARQAGLKIAKGEIIVSTDSDSFFRPDWLANIWDYYQKNPNTIGLAGHYYFYKAAFWAKIMPPMGAVLVWMISKFIGRPVYVSAVNLSFRKKYFSGYDTKFPQGADERGVLLDLIQKGRVDITLNNPVYTSSRRVNQGFLHSMIVTVGYYYSYNVWRTKKAGYSKIGSPPAIRTEDRMAHWPILAVQWFVIISILVILVLSFNKHIYLWDLL